MVRGIVSVLSTVKHDTLNVSAIFVAWTDIKSLFSALTYFLTIIVKIKEILVYTIVEMPVNWWLYCLLLTSRNHGWLFSIITDHILLSFIGTIVLRH